MKLILDDTPYSLDEFRALQSRLDWIVEIQSFMKEWHSDSGHLVIQTSGSTGDPKEIELPKSSFQTSARITNSFFNLKTTDKAHLCLPIRYIAGKMMLIRALEAKMDLYIEKPTSIPLMAISDKIDFTAMTPFQTECLLDEAPEKMNQIQTLIIGGSGVSKGLRQKLSRLKTRCYQTYGMTETLTHIAIQNLNGSRISDTFEVLPQFEVSVDDRNCLVIEADHILHGQVVTNDIVELLGKHHFKWLGRADNVINSGGIKISPETVELRLSDLISNPFFIAGEKDDRIGEKVVLCIEGSPWTEEDKDDLMSEMQERLNKYEIPRSILFFDCFIYTPSGKIQRQKTLAAEESE